MTPYTLPNLLTALRIVLIPVIVGLFYVPYGWGDILAHHLALVAPARVIAFGSSVLSLLGHDPAQKSAFFSPVNHGDLRVPLLGARELAMLLERPATKAAFWQSWLRFQG